MNSLPFYLQMVTFDQALELGLRETEYSHLKEVLGRDLNYLEAGIFSALYSEHCSYKSTKIHLKTLPTDGPAVIHGPGENAGVVDIGDGQAVVFKVESHNHPSFIEPFQGAATGVGGILRDVFTMGARPLALMNGLRFGDPKLPRTRYLLSNAVHGIGSYGNAVGIPTVAGELFFHPSYDGNCLVNAFALGLVEKDKIFLGSASGVGNKIVYLGSKTGRDGIHGATMASAEFDESSSEKRPTVQVGDPFQEKLLIEACLEIMASGAVVGIQDMGAAGMTSSSYEMAARAGTGLRLDLDLVPMREEGMNPYEIMLSESQERMLLIVAPENVEQVLDLVKKWELDAVTIGEVVEGKNVDLYWHGQNVSSLPVEVAVQAAPQLKWEEKEPAEFRSRISFSVAELEPPADLAELWLKMLASPNLCSRAPVFTQYDSTVRSNTVIHPGGNAGVIRIKSENTPEKGIALKLDCNSRYCGIDPYQGAALSVLEGYRNITATGATPIGISDCLNFGSPEKPEGMWQIAQAIRGMNEACRALTLPIVSGNVSLYNETKGQSILPTPMIATVGLIKDASKAIGSHFRQAGDCIFVIGETKSQLGGSEYLSCAFDVERGALPEIDYDLEIKTAKFLRSLIDKKLLCSSHDISQGGLAIALAECCLTMNISSGATIQRETTQGGGNEQVLVNHKEVLYFSESGCRYIVSCTPENAQTVRDSAKSEGLTISLSGHVGGERISIDGDIHIRLSEALDTWSNGLKELI